jgi:type II secretory pathway pseudopilin PulG
MVVVVAIIGVIAGVSFPAISAGLESVRMVSATDSVATFMNSAVNRAERRQQAIALLVDPKEGTLSLYSAEPGFEKHLKLPEGVAIEAVLPADGAGESKEERRFLFLPGATVPAIGIQLTNGHNAHRLVQLDPMTGFPRVKSIEPQVIQ